MCGIGGIIGKVSQNSILALLQMLQTRGTDATGMALIEGGKVFIYKTPGPAFEAVKEPYFRKFLKEHPHPDAALVHCRAATHGSPLLNVNNHPIFNEDGLIIHNGIIWDAPKELKGMKGDTDTEGLLFAIQEYGLKEGIQKCSGTLSIAYVPFDGSGKIWFYTNSNALYFAQTKASFFFCSEARMLYAIGVPTTQPAKMGYLYNLRITNRKLQRGKEALEVNGYWTSLNLNGLGVYSGEVLNPRQYPLPQKILQPWREDMGF